MCAQDVFFSLWPLNIFMQRNHDWAVGAINDVSVFAPIKIVIDYFYQRIVCREVRIVEAARFSIAMKTAVDSVPPAR